MRILITGITGWTGSYLANHLLQSLPDAELVGLAWGPAASKAPAGIPIIQVDLTDNPATDQAIGEFAPQRIYHLAAAVGPIWSIDADRAMRINVMGTANLLQAAARLQPSPRVLIAISSAIYGRAGDQPITEAQPLAPLSLYGISKAAQDMLAYRAHAVDGLHTVRVRTFNQTGPGEPAHLVGGAIARQVARAEAKIDEPVVRVGNLAPERDIVDVRDVVRGYVLAMEAGGPGSVFNLCRGQSWSVRQLLDMLLQLSPVALRVEQRVEQRNPAEIARQVGDPTRLFEASGWRARIPLQQSLADLLHSWRERVADAEVERP